MESLRAIRSPSALFDRDAGRRASRAMTALMATPLAGIEDYSGKGMGLGGAMSGRFDGKPSTIGNTSKYTPAHDCREGSLKMLTSPIPRAARTTFRVRACR